MEKKLTSRRELLNHAVYASEGLVALGLVACASPITQPRTPIAPSPVKPEKVPRPPAQSSKPTFATPEVPQGSLEQLLQQEFGRPIGVEYDSSYSASEIQEARRASAIAVSFLSRIQQEAGVSLWKEEVETVQFRKLPGNVDGASNEFEEGGKRWRTTFTSANYYQPDVHLNELTSLLKDPEYKNHIGIFLSDTLSNLITLRYEELYGPRRTLDGRIRYPTFSEAVAAANGLLLIPGQDYRMITAYGTLATHFPQSLQVSYIWEAFTMHAANAIKNKFGGNVNATLQAMLQAVARPSQPHSFYEEALKDLEDRKILSSVDFPPVPKSELLIFLYDFSNTYQYTKGKAYTIRRPLIFSDGSRTNYPKECLLTAYFPQPRGTQTVQTTFALSSPGDAYEQIQMPLSEVIDANRIEIRTASSINQPIILPKPPAGVRGR